MSPRTTTGSTDGQITDAQREEALNTPTELTFWTWVPDIQDQVDMFEAEYPDDPRHGRERRPGPGSLLKGAHRLEGG